MVDQTPTVTLKADDTTGAIKQFFKSLFWWQWVITGVVIVAIIGTVIFAVHETSVKNKVKTVHVVQVAETWKRWHRGFNPVFATSIADYNVIAGSLSSNSATAQDFTNLDNDALVLATFDNSLNPKVNTEVKTLSADLQQLASDGTAVYAGGGSLTTFDSDVAVVDTQFGVVNKALAAIKQ